MPAHAKPRPGKRAGPARQRHGRAPDHEKAHDQGHGPGGRGRETDPERATRPGHPHDQARSPATEREPAPGQAKATNRPPTGGSPKPETSPGHGQEQAQGKAGQGGGAKHHPTGQTS